MQNLTAIYPLLTKQFTDIRMLSATSIAKNEVAYTNPTCQFNNEWMTKKQQESFLKPWTRLL